MKLKLLVLFFMLVTMPIFEVTAESPKKHRGRYKIGTVKYRSRKIDGGSSIKKFCPYCKRHHVCPVCGYYRGAR